MTVVETPRITRLQFISTGLYYKYNITTTSNLCVGHLSPHSIDTRTGLAALAIELGEIGEYSRDRATIFKTYNARGSEAEEDWFITFQ